MAGGEKSKQSRSGRLAGHPLSAGANVPLGVLSDTWEPDNASQQPHATGHLSLSILQPDNHHPFYSTNHKYYIDVTDTLYMLVGGPWQY